MTQLSILKWCSFTDRIYTTSIDWGKFRVEFISNLCNALAESFDIGLKILVSGVQIPVLASPQTSLLAGFSSFQPSLVFCPTGVNLPIIPVYWGNLG
jgi:hypothetical protein